MRISCLLRSVFDLHVFNTSTLSMWFVHLMKRCHLKKKKMYPSINDTEDWSNDAENSHE